MVYCPICKSDKRKKLGEKNNFEAFRCLACYSLFTEKISEEAEDFNYAEYYELGNLSVPDFVHQTLKTIVSGFEGYRKNNRLLDVGCGAGILLESAQSAGWEVEGVEVSQTSVEHLRQRGFKVFHGTLEQADYPDDYFDVVTATEVIEHVDNPREMLQGIARILRPNGLLWVTTPHANGISAKMLGMEWSVVCPPEHLHLFSCKGLETILQEAGFLDCKIVTNGFNPFEIFHYYKGKGISASNESINDEVKFNRVDSVQQLNETLSGTGHKAKLKKTINSLINVLGVGDTIKVWAVLRK